MKKLLFCFLSVCLLCSLSHATLSFRMTSANTELVVGEETTIIVSVYDPDIVSGEGVDTWQFDLWIDAVSDIIQVESVSDYAPYPNFQSGYRAKNDEVTVNGTGTGVGNVDWINVVGYGLASDLGYNDYTPIVTITMKAIAAGEGTYSLGINPDGIGDFSAYLVGAIDPVSCSFDALGSDTQFTVSAPEPCTLILLVSGGVGICGMRRKK